MTTAAISYGTPTAITITLTSLADGAYRESAAVDNSSNLFMDAHVAGSVQVGTVTADGTFAVFAYGSNDGGTTYSGGLAGTDETITWGTTPSTSSVEGYNNLKLLGVVSVDTTDDDNDIEFGPFAVASAFGGHMPNSWGIVILNETGAALHATGTNNSIKYTGIKYTAA
jgi:hypothetical protein